MNESSIPTFDQSEIAFLESARAAGALPPAVFRARAAAAAAAED